MFYSILILATAALTSAQNGSTSGYYSTSGPLEIDPNSVSPDLRQAWCRGQQNNCPKICGGPDAGLGAAYPNQCDPATLDWTCTCANGNQPNISDYADTIPSYVCQRWREYCTADHPNDLEGQTACQSVTCGERNASGGASGPSGTSGSSSGGDSSASSSASSPSSTASSSGDDSDSSESGSPSSSASGAAASQTGDNAAVAVGMNYGTGLLMGGMFAIFGLAL